MKLRSVSSISAQPAKGLAGENLIQNSDTANPGDAELPSTPHTPPAVAKKRTIRFPGDLPPLSLDEPISATTRDVEVVESTEETPTEGGK